jgi:hypothetical protein
MIKYVKSLPWSKCKNNFQLRNNTILPQQQHLEQFIVQQEIIDIYKVDVNKFELPSKAHELIVFVINPTDLISIQSVDSMINNLKQYALKYYYIAVNKFLIYTEQDQATDIECTTNDLDTQLIEHWTKITNLKVVWVISQSTDHGHLGNFVHPVTNMMFEL